MKKVNIVEFRKHLSEYVGQIRYAGVCIALTHHGKVVGGFVPAEILSFLEEQEMLSDIEAYDRGMEKAKKKGRISLKEFKKSIGL